MAQHPKVEYIRMYTDGSAARKLEVAAPVRKASLPRARRQKKILFYVDPIAFGGIAVAVIMFVVMAVSVINLYGVQQETARLESYVTDLRTENAALRAEYETGFDIGNVELTARALGMVPSEQVRHVTVQVQQLQTVEDPGAWEQVRTFLAGLFA